MTFENLEKTELLDKIKGFGYDSSLFEKYQASDLKLILDDIKKIEVEATAKSETRKDITKWVLIGIGGILAAIIIIKKL